MDSVLQMGKTTHTNVYTQGHTHTGGLSNLPRIIQRYMIYPHSLCSWPQLLKIPLNSLLPSYNLNDEFCLCVYIQLYHKLEDHRS